MKRLLQFFVFAHLKNSEMQNVSEQFANLADWMSKFLPENAESTVAMRKLLEAKDCAVRSIIYKEPTASI